MTRCYRHVPLLILIGVCFLILGVAVKVTMFRYLNYEYGKFDLGNMSQMVYNSLHGNFMEVTDYFGTNMPRWGMSHVDPFLLVFVPFYAFFPDPRVLIVGQLALLIFSALPIYFLARKVLAADWPALFLSLAYLFYPANGYLLAWTGFHSVTAVVPFFITAFLIFEDMHSKRSYPGFKMFLFFVMLFLTMMGKEEISLIIVMYGLFILLFRRSKKVGSILVLSGLVWFAVAFFVIIPRSAHYRIEGYKRFAKSVDLDVDPGRDVLKPNYFLSRYDDFGSSYLEVFKNVVFNPVKVSEVFFSGDKKENFSMTFLPVLYLPFFYIPVLSIAAPEFVINYLTTSGGIGTSEIYNHRISMIIPILFISLVYAISFWDQFSKTFFRSAFKFLPHFLAFILLLSNIYYSHKFGNPIMLWFTQSLSKRIQFKALAKEPEQSVKGYGIGDQVKINRLETKDRRCFDEALSLIPSDFSVTSPDYLGDHLSLRKVNALFPANFDTSDFVIVDVFSKKVQTILGVDSSLVSKVVGKVVRDPNYKLVYSCSNLFVFKRVGYHEKSDILPLQERFEYSERVSYNIGASLNLADYLLPAEVERGEDFHISFVFKKSGTESLNSFILFTSFLNVANGQIYQVANLPSFGIRPLSEWPQDMYFVEDNNFVLPASLKPGIYKTFVGMTNNIKNYNIYLGEVKVK
ncbi:DUF2079 domain-containing protein [candidate division WWE3 bacterium]|nr:DUF2079 domain-containing protein [candidate division WWE3 bacterium]